MCNWRRQTLFRPVSAAETINLQLLDGSYFDSGGDDGIRTRHSVQKTCTDFHETSKCAKGHICRGLFSIVNDRIIISL
jgi:hypothetical protein